MATVLRQMSREGLDCACLCTPVCVRVRGSERTRYQANWKQRTSGDGTRCRDAHRELERETRSLK